VDEFNVGKAYADTSDCHQSIRTIHAMIEAKNALLHINVSQFQTEIIVISGVAQVILRENTMHSVDLKSEQELIVTHDAIGRVRPVTQDEIWQRIRWRDDFKLYKTVVDWDKVLKGAVLGAIIAAAILVPRAVGHSGFNRPRYHGWR
jgi:hypothetical protein